jgi:hypothetical protein
MAPEDHKTKVRRAFDEAKGNVNAIDEIAAPARASA